MGMEVNKEKEEGMIPHTLEVAKIILDALRFCCISIRLKREIIYYIT